MSSKPVNIKPADTSPEEADSYVDPILFVEGAYSDQADYERTIDDFAERINKGLATPRGREPKHQVPFGFSPEHALLQEAIQKLPATQRKIIEMSNFQGLKDNEIAKSLSISLGTLKGLKQMALEALSKSIKQ